MMNTICTAVVVMFLVIVSICVPALYIRYNSRILYYVEQFPGKSVDQVTRFY